jgi:hypothetical protein
MRQATLPLVTASHFPGLRGRQDGWRLTAERGHAEARILAREKRVHKYASIVLVTALVVPRAKAHQLGIPASAL